MHPPPLPPGPGQESVWDYPLPPVAVASDERVRVVHRGTVLADTSRSIRIQEYSYAPPRYLPRADVSLQFLVPSGRRTVCEWKGVATHFDLVMDGVTVQDVAWSYEVPVSRLTAIREYIAFFPQRVDECWVDDERVAPREGDYDGGWVTSRVVGPFKVGPDEYAW